MTEIERKALELCNEVQAERNHAGSPWNSPTILNEALYRAIERHEAFRQEVSDAVMAVFTGYHDAPIPWVVMRRKLEPFIIPKPVDPLAEAMHDCGVDRFESWADELRAAIEKRGGKIVWEQDQ